MGDNPAPLPPRHEPPPASATTAQGTSSPTMHTPTQPPAHSVQTVMRELTLQLETLARTVSTLLALHPDLAQIDTSRTKQALDNLSNTLQMSASTIDQQPPTKPTPTQPSHTKTYAATAATTPAKKPNTPAPNTQPGRTRPSQPLRPVESKRLIVDLCGLLPTKNPAPLQIRDELNRWLNDSGLNNFKVSAVKRTNSKNVVLSFSPPGAVYALLRPELRPTFLTNLKILFGIQKGLIEVYPDDKWHRVVINKIPITGPGLPSKNIKEALVGIQSDWKTFNGVGSETWSTVFRHMRLLVPPDVQHLASPETISICLAFPDAKHARRLLREGAFINGAHCRTSIYISRHR